MQAIILSAGKGIRLYPLTKKIPKVMVEVKGKPLLKHHLMLLRKYEIKEIFINLFTLPDIIKNYFGDGRRFGVRIKYATESTLLGSAGALQNFKKELKDNFFVLYGDVYMQIDLLKMLNFHKRKNSLFTLVMHEAKHPQDSDLLEINYNQRITNWIKTPHSRKSGVNSAGLYIINKSVLKYLPKKVPFDFSHDFIPFLMKKIPMFAYYTTELIMDIGTPERYNKLLSILKK
ncbi:nucleotidyltransferase family protein [Candidatus Roizmanbacteria bacterium]|nr:nucleotidyltransferase family protein [Candidatus Roizmanbacteria bacterium]